MRVYLDNCCYNRPYDDQSQMRIFLETQAKLYIQDLIRRDKAELVTSYVLDYENDKNFSIQKKNAIQKFMNDNESYYVGEDRAGQIEDIAKRIIETGIKEMDAYHVAVAVFAKCDYFIKTDDRILKYKSKDIETISPDGFIKNWRGCKMPSTMEIIDKGIACLVEQMGVVEAEYFIATIKRENFDYTEWRKKYFDNFQQGQFHEEAVAYAKANPHTGKGKRL